MNRQSWCSYKGCNPNPAEYGYDWNNVLAAHDWRGCDGRRNLIYICTRSVILQEINLRLEPSNRALMVNF